jgi:outer membrane protein OmpA-like peptidoglycan-associated protein
MGAYTEITRDLYLAPIEVGQSVRLNNIFFEYDKSEILGGSVYELDRLVKIMKENPGIVIQIRGHTDNLGTEAYNQKLSEDRARAVYTYILSKNIGNDRVSSVGFGESRPLASNDTEEGRALNRRVEFVIVSK